MKTRFFSAALVSTALAVLVFASKSSAISVVGALSNFDLYNDTGEYCDEFELIISNTVPTQLYGTWNYNPDYGTPEVTDIGGSTRVHYIGHTNNITLPGSIEHFGAILSAFPTNGVLYTWMHAGTNVGVGRQFPAPFVTIVTVSPTLANPEGRGRHREVRNTDHTNTFWVQRLTVRTNRNVTLDELMTNNPVVMSTTNMDDHPKRLVPGGRLSDDDDAGADDTDSEVVSLQIFADNNGHPGHIIGNFLSSAQTIRRSRVEGVHREQDGRQTLNFTVEPTTNYIVQASDDMLHWTNIGLINTNRPDARFTDNDSTNLPSRYYRLQQQ
jgi:hypothetical protein